MHRPHRRWPAALIVAAVAALTVIALWRTRGDSESADLIAATGRPEAIMGTSCRVVVVMPADQAGRRRAALDAAERTLRRVEALCSTHIESSELSRLNAGHIDQVSFDLWTVLSNAKRAYESTDGAFDVTARPLFELWKRAAQQQRLPTAEKIAEARTRSRWDLVAIADDRKHVYAKAPTVAFDLNGIAKGYAIDRAIEAMRDAGAVGGLVDVGGDVRCFGVNGNGQGWRVGLRDPFGDRVLFFLRLTDRAVCTSGNYARFVTIGGNRYSHIIDPRTGTPADHAPSVTVIAPAAAAADAWATALSVLGPQGLAQCPPGTEAMVVTGTAEDYAVHTTPGFHRSMGKD